MKISDSVTVRRALWPDEAEYLREIRAEVFIVEQDVPEELEWDGSDDACMHVIALDGDNAAIGTGRMTRSGKIGRMAVLKPWRGHGVGQALVAELIKVARGEGFAEVSLGAQTHAIGFYEQLGFVAYGDVFDDAGMPHRSMRMRLDD